jgi:diphthamide biosynthesis protein 3
MSDEDELAIYDEIEFEDLTWDEAMQVYSYPCPCGDRFQITLDDLRDEQDIAVCPSCSLMIRVIYDLVRGALREALRSSKSCHFVAKHPLTFPFMQDDLPKPPPSSESGTKVPIAA